MEQVTEQMVCSHCESPLNLAKARRRYTKKFGHAPKGGLLMGLCACGEYVVDKNYYRRLYNMEKDAEEREARDRLAGAVAVVSISR